MKKLLLLVVLSTALLYGCGASGPYADIENQMAKHEGACADIAFKNTHAAIDKANVARSKGVSESQISKLDIVVKQNYDDGMRLYTSLKGRSDKSHSLMSEQVSRMDAIKDKAKSSDANTKKYNAMREKVTPLHAKTKTALDECKVANAEQYLDDAERLIKPLETALGVGAKVASSNGEVYTVQSGDCLWKIAARKYSNPYFWPLIYWSNKSSIKDPDLIYPNQKLSIEDASSSTKADASKFARTRGPWSLYDNK